MVQIFKRNLFGAALARCSASGALDDLPLAVSIGCQPPSPPQQQQQEELSAARKSRTAEKTEEDAHRLYCNCSRLRVDLKAVDSFSALWATLSEPSEQQLQKGSVQMLMSDATVGEYLPSPCKPPAHRMRVEVSLVEELEYERLYRTAYLVNEARTGSTTYSSISALLDACPALPSVQQVIFSTHHSILLIEDGSALSNRGVQDISGEEKVTVALRNGVLLDTTSQS